MQRDFKLQSIALAIEQTDWRLIYLKEPETKIPEIELNMRRSSTAMICPVFLIWGLSLRCKQPIVPATCIG